MLRKILYTGTGNELFLLILKLFVLLINMSLPRDFVSANKPRDAKRAFLLLSSPDQWEGLHNIEPASGCSRVLRATGPSGCIV